MPKIALIAVLALLPIAAAAVASAAVIETSTPRLIHADGVGAGCDLSPPIIATNVSKTIDEKNGFSELFVFSKAA